MKTKIALFVLLVLLSNVSIVAARYTAKDDTYLRLWCECDIETFTEKVKQQGAKAGDLLKDETVFEYEVMQRVMFGLLKNWPLQWETLMTLRQGHVGLDFLEYVWKNWKTERFRLLQDLFAAAAHDTYPAFDRWEERWGPDPEPYAPSNKLPPEVDCKWYLVIDHKEPGFIFKAVYQKSEGWDGHWEVSNMKGYQLHIVSSSDCGNIGAIWGDEYQGLDFDVDSSSLYRSTPGDGSFPLETAEGGQGEFKYSNMGFDVEIPVRHKGSLRIVKGRVDTVPTSEWKEMLTFFKEARRMSHSDKSVLETDLCESTKK